MPLEGVVILPEHGPSDGFHQIDGNRRPIYNWAAFRYEMEEIDVPATTGKRYTCEKCGAQVIVTKGGTATLYCKHPDGSKVALKQQ